jgi:tetratricopeptide (TPR) repeat protein
MPKNLLHINVGGRYANIKIKDQKQYIFDLLGAFMQARFLKTLLLSSLFLTILPGAKAHTAVENESAQLSLIEQQSRYEKEKAEYLQTYVLDKIMGPGKAIVIVNVELSIETKRSQQSAQERKSEKKKRLGDIDYLLPGVPNPKSVTQESAPGESKEETGQADQVKYESKTVIKQQIVTVLYDEKIAQAIVDAVREAIVTSLKIDTKRGDKIEFKKTKFTQGFLEEVLKPKVLIPLVVAVLMLFFLFGPVSSFLRQYVKTLREKGGTEVTVDSKFEGGPGDEEGGGGGGGGGALTPAELDALEKEKEKYHPFSFVDDENLKRLVYIIRKEPPKIIALVISYLKPEHVKEMLTALDPEVQAQVAVEMATIRQMTQDQVLSIDNNLKEKIDFLVGGLEHLLQVFEGIDKSTTDNILAYLQDQRPELYEKVRKFIITFEDIPNFPDQAIQVIIRELKSESLAKALRNVQPEISNKFFSNMSANAAAILKEEMEYGRPLTNEEIEQERKKILDVIKQLEKDGKIFVREKPKNVGLEGLQETEPDVAGAETQDSGAFTQYFEAGTQLYEGAQYQDAIGYFQYCLTLGVNLPMVYQYLGNCYYAMGSSREATQMFEKSLELNPENADLKNWLAAQQNTIK